jgi:hypothetical protein
MTAEILVWYETDADLIDVRMNMTPAQQNKIIEWVGVCQNKIGYVNRIG